MVTNLQELRNSPTFPPTLRIPTQVAVIQVIFHTIMNMPLNTDTATKLKLVINSFYDKIYPWHIPDIWSIFWHFPDSLKNSRHLQFFPDSGHPVIVNPTSQARQRPNNKATFTCQDPRLQRRATETVQKPHRNIRPTRYSNVLQGLPYPSHIKFTHCSRQIELCQQTP